MSDVIIKKSVTGICWEVVVGKKTLYRDTHKYLCEKWVEDNPSVVRIARKLAEMDKKDAVLQADTVLDKTDWSF